MRTGSQGMAVEDQSIFDKQDKIIQKQAESIQPKEEEETNNNNRVAEPTEIGKKSAFAKEEEDAG